MKRIIDLTFEINLRDPSTLKKLPYNLGKPGWNAIVLESLFKVIPWAYGLDNTLVEHVILWSHVGTHIEAPYHQDPSGKSVGELSLDLLIGEGVILNVTDVINEEDFLRSDLEKEINERYGMLGPLIKKKHLDRFSNKINDGDIVLFYSNLSIENRALLSEEAADWLVEKHIKAVGTHDWSVIFSKRAHEKLLMNGIPIIETLVNLDKIKKERVFIIALPLKIIGLGASPARVIAIEEL
ncbi:MAG: cyclase family protein [Desulfurococcaceae archaeon]